MCSTKRVQCEGRIFQKSIIFMEFSKGGGAVKIIDYLREKIQWGEGLKYERKKKLFLPNYDLPPHTHSGQNHGLLWTSRWPPMKML